MSTPHRAQGYGRYRAAPPRHAARRPGHPAVPFRRAGPLLATAGVLNVVSVALIGAALVVHPAAAPAPAPVTLPRVQPPAEAVPYRIAGSIADAVRRRAKVRPVIRLGTPAAADLTRWCAHAGGPLTIAVADGSGWLCRPLLGDPAPVAMTDACRFLYDRDDAYARNADRVWRCYRDGP